MIDRFQIRANVEATREMIELANWAWDSHWWVENYPGYCECKWCGAKHTSEQPVSKDFPMCLENYAVKPLLSSKGG